MLTGQQKLAFARLQGLPKDGYVLFESTLEKDKVFQAKITTKPYEFNSTEVTFNAPAWLPQEVVDNYILEQLAKLG